MTLPSLFIDLSLFGGNMTLRKEPLPTTFAGVTNHLEEMVVTKPDSAQTQLSRDHVMALIKANGGVCDGIDLQNRKLADIDLPASRIFNSQKGGWLELALIRL